MIYQRPQSAAWYKKYVWTLFCLFVCYCALDVYFGNLTLTSVYFGYYSGFRDHCVCRVRKARYFAHNRKRKFDFEQALTVAITGKNIFVNGKFYFSHLFGVWKLNGHFEFIWNNSYRSNCWCSVTMVDLQSLSLVTITSLSMWSGTVYELHFIC